MFGPSGWSRDFVLTPQTRFVGSHTSTDVTLNLSQLQRLLAKIASLTSSPAFGTFSVAVGPQIQIAGSLAGAGEAPLLAYQDAVFARFRDYLRLRLHLYGLERRWPDTPFWRNRL